MTKKETIWRFVLHEALTKRTLTFTQKKIAERFAYSTSTVFNALKIPRKLGAVEVTGRFFRLRDAEKLLLLWATQRNLERDIIYKTHVDLPVKKIESGMPADAIFGAFSAYRFAHGDAPADYSVVYVYAQNTDKIAQRFPLQKAKKATPNLYVLKSDAHLASFGKTTPDVQTFVDLWNMSEWYAKDFLEALKLKIFTH
ncbi:winged helix-turn-helix domain-containing protein [Candidatus Peregrinibacteria bacterium]|nr:winged helix-turn-helix domain-containing protein [Candidatus Peregrinibacteria bacterium]